MKFEIITGVFAFLLVILFLILASCNGSKRRRIIAPKPSISTYEALWGDQSSAHYNVTIHLSPDRILDSFEAKVGYLDDVLSDVFANFVHYHGCHIQVEIGPVIYEYDDIGCFNTARVVLLMIETGLDQVFKANAFTVDMTCY